MIEGHARSLAKAFSWRISASIWTVAIAFIFTRKVFLSLSIGAVEFVTKIFFYYIHERIWEKINFDRKRPEYEI
ncbi:MAG: hypothetical protein COS94_06805 [Candidatus Hydrogenedentes bacterium CG07_land_8_20_14_0_80_42_17]|nr:MAG: hypothetical protein COS94_06805 [Candidatus Hydrogenedentes bacterium CG07_land_8_20_14_0_80_42_17]